MVDDDESLRQFLYAVPVGLLQISAAGDIALLNGAAAQLLMPLVRQAGLDNLFTALDGVMPDLRRQVAGFGPAHGIVCDGVHLQFDAGGSDRSGPLFVSFSLHRIGADRFIATLADITRQVLREQQLRQSEAWFNAALTGISDHAVVSLDAEGCIDDWHASAEHMTGFTREAVLGRPYAVFYPEGAITPDRVLDRLREADRNGWSIDEGWRVKADGTPFWGSLMIVPVRMPGRPAVSAYCLVIRDITDKREASECRRQAVASDYLTGLANRRAFFEAAELEIERCQRSPRPLSLIMFDADHFKQVNDRHGHPAGDAVLQHLAGLLATTFRQIDVVARLGGEEFAVLLPSTDLPAAEAAANRLRLAVAAQPVEVDGTLIRYTVSGGVTMLRDSASGIDALIRQADRALYAAKARGRNCIAVQGLD